MIGFKFSKHAKVFFAIYIVGILFKIQHWLYASEILAGSCIMIIIFQSIDLWRSKSKTIVSYINALLVISFFSYWTLKMLHWPYKIPFLIIAGICFVSLMIIDSFFPFLKEKSEERKEPSNSIFSKNTLYLIGAPIVIIGALFKIQHWPWAQPMLIIGLGIMSLTFLIDFFRK